MSSSIFISVEQSRGIRFTVTMTDKDGANIAVVAGDVVRLKIGRRGAAPILDLDSASPSSNASTVERANPFEVVLTAADAALLSPGVYDVEAAIYAAADGQIKHADHGVVCVAGVMAGDVGAG